MQTSSPSAKGVILITGASSGLGMGMAREFSNRGYDLALCARRLDALNELKAELTGTRVEVAALDVTDHAAVFETFRHLRQQFGLLDKIIINAGIGAGAPIGKGGFEQNRATLEVNLIAALAQAEAAMEIFRDQNKGHLVFMSSLSAIRGMRGQMTSYAASKAGLAHLAEGLRLETLRKPITVTTLMPGYIKSEMTAGQDAAKTPFIIDGIKGARLLADAVESGRAQATIPRWPWTVVRGIMRVSPLWLLRRMN
jgi:short-subunit dehydrogenase